ncbi:DUF5694 domain-containing protein [Ascidiimonas sp. W6]|uniref:DUF5694 domain-containing protein n=1 Tax=Ascidiimonas meishanensis TaxID=3128903 RepID=UPI0030EE8076
MRRILNLIFIILFIACSKNNPEKNRSTKESKKVPSINVLLLGTFHFANFNPENNGDVLEIDVADVLTDENQKELEKIAEGIADFKPDKIFLEYPHSKQNQLDSIYTNFKDTNYSNASRKEIIQIGFRVAKMLKHNQVFAMDYRTDFPYDSLVNQMKKSKQFHLLEKDRLELERIEKFENNLFSSNKSLSEILFYYNDDTNRKSDINWYLSIANQGGNKDNFVGSYLVSEWYKRNLYMYSIIQKTVEPEDKRIMILGGASHIGMFKDFIDKTPDWETTELKEIIQK